MITSFAELGLAAPLARALDGAGYVTPTPIQAQAIPYLMQGRDLLGLAQTGTGKTAAFVLPILQALRSSGTKTEPGTTRALILAPTRELAIQIHETVRTLSKGQHFSHASIFGGVSINPQISALRKGVDIVIATPGRLVDLIKQRCITLNAVKHFVLDEADRMLDMGFIRDIKRILPLLPKDRQSMLFSATMPQAIGEIASGLLRDPVQVEVRPQEIAVDRIDQRIVYLPQNAKREALLKILSAADVTRALVFARTKHGANRLNDYLDDYGVKVDVIHGNKSQGARQRALADFKTGAVKILVATDIAARGIDVANISHVINAELPDEPESYVHRIGRTARAGREGIAITLCDSSERDKLRAVERLIRRPIPVMTIEGLDLKQPRDATRISDDRKPRGARAPFGRDDRREKQGDQRPQSRSRNGEQGRNGAERNGSDRNGPVRNAPGRNAPGRDAPGRETQGRDMSRDAHRRDDTRRDESVQKAGLPRFLDRKPQQDARSDHRKSHGKPHDARPPQRDSGNRNHENAAHGRDNAQHGRDKSPSRDGQRPPQRSRDRSGYSAA